jgi:hypothetical protein
MQELTEIKNHKTEATSRVTVKKTNNTDQQMRNEENLIVDQEK